LSSTRSGRSRNPMSSSVAPFRLNRLRILSRLTFPRELEAQLSDISQARAEIDHLDTVLEAVPPCVRAYCPGNGKPGDVEITQGQQRDPVVAADLIGQLPRRRHAHAFG